MIKKEQAQPKNLPRTSAPERGKLARDGVDKSDLSDEILMKSDEELAGLALDNQGYFLFLIKRYEGKLLKYILRISNVSFEEAEDILQDVFIKVYQNLNDFDLSLKFSSWIYRITHNQVINNFRKNKARPESVAEALDDKMINKLASGLNIEREVDVFYLRKSINGVLAAMDEKYREVLVLKFLEEKNYNEISDILKKPAGTIASLINRAKNNFKEELNRQNIKI